MGVNNVLAAYTQDPDQNGSQLVGRPCNLRGFIVLPSTIGAPNGTKLEFRNSLTIGTDADNLLVFEVGQDTTPGYAISEYTIPGNGIRFDVGIFVVGEDTNIVHAGTVIYQ